MPTPEEAAGYAYTDVEKAFVADRQSNQIIGGPDTVLKGINSLLEQTQADELMVATMVHDPADGRRSYELVAELAELPGGHGGGVEVAFGELGAGGHRAHRVLEPLAPATRSRTGRPARPAWRPPRRADLAGQHHGDLAAHLAVGGPFGQLTSGPRSTCS